MPVTINGTPARTQTLRTTMPSWDGYPSTYGYEWQRCDADGTNCAVIATAKGNAYVLTKADEDSTIRVRLTATNTTGTGESLSAPTAVVVAVVPVAVAPPVISGNVVTGQTLTAARGSWAATTDTSYTFAWQRCAADGTACAPIAAATMPTYKLTADDIGTTIRVIATATNPDGTTTATSVQTAKIKAAPPAAYPMPALSGVAQVGKTVSATTGTWTGIAANVTTTFWRCTTACTAIQTGTDRTYTLTPADAGYKVRASVTGSRPGRHHDDLRHGHPRPGQVGHRRHRRRRRRARLAQGLHRHRAGQGRGQDPGRRRHRDGHRHAGQAGLPGLGLPDRRHHLHQAGQARHQAGQDQGRRRRGREGQRRGREKVVFGA